MCNNDLSLTSSASLSQLLSLEVLVVLFRASSFICLLTAIALYACCNNKQKTQLKMGRVNTNYRGAATLSTVTCSITTFSISIVSLC
jgi:hypothetical protein